jgi:hypothetical protein
MIYKLEKIDQWQRSKDGSQPMAEKKSWNKLCRGFYNNIKVSVLKESSGNFLFNFVFKKTNKILCLTRRLRAVHGRQKTTSQKY